MPEKLEPKPSPEGNPPKGLLGKVFSLEAQKILKAPKEGRRTALKEFKEKWAKQKEGIAAMQETLTKIIEQNPDAPLDKLRQAAGDMNIGLDLKLTDKQQEIVKSVLEKYVEKHNKIKETREKYPDDKELFKALFGKYPVGKIEVVERPVMLYFRIHSIRDFAYVGRSVFREKKSSGEDEIERANQSGGFVLLDDCLIPELNESVVLENAWNINDAYFKINTGMVVSHEEQHIINRLFKGVFQESQIKERIKRGEAGTVTVEKWIETFVDKLKDAKTNSERRSLLTDCFSPIGDEVLSERGKDEILAQLRGDKPETSLAIYECLTKPQDQGGIYDFFEQMKKNIFKPPIRSGIYRRYSALIYDTAEKVLKNQYHQLLKNGTGVVAELQGRGYSNKKITALLINEPLAKWPKVVKGLLEAKN